jgi:hypothetical protein
MVNNPTSTIALGQVENIHKIALINVIH